jgi:hypothetical protein
MCLLGGATETKRGRHLASPQRVRRHPHCKKTNAAAGRSLPDAGFAGCYLGDLSTLNPLPGERPKAHWFQESLQPDRDNFPE